MFGVVLIIAENRDARNMMRIQRRLLRDSGNPFEMPEERFREIYRFSRISAKSLVDVLSTHMIKGQRNTFVPVPNRVCAALHFFATGSFQRDIGQDFITPLSRTMISRAVHEVAEILQNKLMATWIQFPNVEEYDAIKQRFYEKTGFPGVIGAIDCTHVKIKRPNRDVESCYFNRKGYHSKNVQLICDYNLKILAGNARFAGATHDAYVWEASRINALLEMRYESNKELSAWLLGDSGYPLRPWVMTPYQSSSSSDERHFNLLHAKARNCIERLNGVLKSVFRCLQVGLHTSPSAAGKIINACCVLHNMRVSYGLVHQDLFSGESNSNELYLPSDTINSRIRLRDAMRIRDRLKTNFARRENM